MPKHFSQQFSVSAKEKIQKIFLFPAYPPILFLPADKKYSCPFRHMKPMQNKDQKKSTKFKKEFRAKNLGETIPPKQTITYFLNQHTIDPLFP